MTTPNKISVVVVSWNVAALLEDCINSLLASQPTTLDIEIIVVDNASRDGSPDLVRQNFPNVRLIANQHNYGFGFGCNQGWQAADGEFIFFLNPDATVTSTTLQTLLEFMQTHPSVKICGPQLRYPDGSLQSNRRRFLSPGLALVESTILQRYRPFKNMKGLTRFYMEEPSDPSPEVSQAVDWLVGAALFVRRTDLAQVGGFDERYFMYSEESDLCRKLGGAAWYLPTAQVMHREGRSSAKDVPQRHINFHTSKVSYFRKWYGPAFGYFLRMFLLATYIFQGMEESVKFLVGHKRELRRERLYIVGKVLASRLRPYHNPWLLGRLQDTKIGLVTAEYWPQAGGVGDYTACIAQALVEKGASQFEIISGPTNIKSKDKDKNKNINPAEAIGHTFYNYKILKRPISNWKWSGILALAKYIHQAKLDLINIQYQTGAYGMHPAINCLPLYLRANAKLSKLPCPQVVTTFHDLREPYLFPKAGPVRRWVTQLLLRSSDCAIVTNLEDYSHALKLGAKATKLKLIPIGSNISPLPQPDMSTREQWRHELGLEPQQFVIGYFGLLNRSKGVDILLQALAQLKQELDLDWRLLIIGGETGSTDTTNNIYADELTKLAAQLGITNKIIRTGQLDPLKTSQALYSLDLAALPFADGASFRRGSLLAALAHSLPVITTATNEIKTKTIENRESWPKVPQLSHEKDCYIVEPKNAVTLAEGIRYLYTKPDLRELIRHAAAKLACQNFSWSHIADALLEVYQLD
jgi:GT2 family glycosyltransferase/glycosyltransferase involved in cell wall biosynthesis